MGLSCLPLSLYTRESQMGKTTPQIMPTATGYRKERHQRHHHGEASFSSQGEPEPPPLLVPCPRRLYLPLPGSHEPPMPCRLELITVAQPSSSLQNHMVMSKRVGKIMDTFKQLCAS